MPLPTVVEKHHPGRSCEPCELCGIVKHRYTHPEDWEDVDHEKELVTKLSGIALKICINYYCTSSTSWYPGHPIIVHGRKIYLVLMWRHINYIIIHSQYNIMSYNNTI